MGSTGAEDGSTGAGDTGGASDGGTTGGGTTGGETVGGGATGGTGTTGSGSGDIGSTGRTGTSTVGTGTTGDPGGSGTGLRTCPDDIGDRPPHAMYACCSVSGGDVSGCLQVLNAICITDRNSGVGFCTAPGCEDPEADCDPAPEGSGTAVPTCIDDGTDTFCALDCQDGPCPLGMTCRAITVLGQPHEICF